MMAAVSGYEQALTEAELAGLDAYASSDLFSAIEKAVLQLAVEMTSTPVRIDEANFEALKAHFSEKELVELSSAIAWENWRARFNHSFGIESAGFAANDAVAESRSDGRGLPND